MKNLKILNLVPLLLFLLLGVGQAFAVWDGSSIEAAQVSNIGGTDYYIIDTEEKLAWFAQQVNSGKVNYNAKLTANLDMGHKLWTPIAAGNNKNNYKGIFDGDNHVIFNLYINAEELIAKYNDKDMAQNIGFIGTGIMGAAMAGHLMDAGFRLSVYNRTKLSLFMGLCRGLNVLSGAVVVGMCGIELAALALVAPLVWTLYITVVTWYSTGEENDPDKKRRVGILVGGIIYLQLAALIYLTMKGASVMPLLVTGAVLLVLLRLMRRVLPRVSAS